MYHKNKLIHIHPVSSFRERLNHNFLVILLPSLHVCIRIRVNDRPNIVCNIFLLSSFIVKRHPERGQGLNGISYIDLGAAPDTYMKIWKAKVDEFLQKLKHPLASRWNLRCYRRLIECVHDEVDGTLIRE